MGLYSELLEKRTRLCVVGLGYVGMPLAVAFSKHFDVIGFDINKNKIQKYKSGIDPTKELGDECIKKAEVYFTDDETKIRNAKFIVVAVPTPINNDKTPNLNPVEESSKIVGRNLSKGSIVVYESTVYPGVTEDICVPILEKESGLINGVDFKVGYSPERINPGDKINRLETIVKIVSGQDQESLDVISKVYSLVVKAGIYPASSIKVAEAAKVVENSQRDINIAFMNELAIVFNLMNIDTKEVIEAMNTKWNALKFYPGLVGGHCIGVDPYYFIYEAERLGYHSQIVLAGRKINDSMGAFVASNIVKKIIQNDLIVSKARVVILGITFKENCPDIRNSKVVDIIRELSSYGIKPIIIDPVANKEEVMEEYGIELSSFDDSYNSDVFVLAVPHKEFLSIPLSQYEKYYSTAHPKILIDVKSSFVKNDLDKYQFDYWRL